MYHTDSWPELTVLTYLESLKLWVDTTVWPVPVFWR